MAIAGRAEIKSLIMELDSQYCFVNTRPLQARPSAHERPDGNLRTPSSAREAANPPFASDIRPVKRIYEAEDAAYLQPPVHTVTPSKKIQTFLKIASNGHSLQLIDLHV